MSNIQRKKGKFEELANEIGQFTDKKNAQYGSSVDATYEVMKVLLERYRYSGGHYLIPEELIQHLLLQVRMMDKINRIFQNPSGKGDSESPYKDLGGYSLIGIDMAQKISERVNELQGDTYTLSVAKPHAHASVRVSTNSTTNKPI